MAKSQGIEGGGTVALKFTRREYKELRRYVTAGSEVMARDRFSFPRYSAASNIGNVRTPATNIAEEDSSAIPGGSLQRDYQLRESTAVQAVTEVDRSRILRTATAEWDTEQIVAVRSHIGMSLLAECADQGIPLAHLLDSPEPHPGRDLHERLTVAETALRASGAVSPAASSLQ